MHYRLLFRCTCGLWASVGFCHHVHAVMSKHRRVEGVKDDLVVKFLRPMQNPVAQRQFAGEERHGRLRNAVPGALVRQPDSPSFVSAAQLRATAASMGVAHGIRRGGKERTRLMQAIASEAVRQHSPRPGAGSSSTSGDAAGGAHGDAGGGHCDGGSSSAAAGSAGASSAGAGSAGAAHPMLVRAEAEAGSGGSGSRQGGGGTRTRTRRQEAQAQPSAAAAPPRFPVLLRNPQCTGCNAVFPNGGALAAHLEETEQCRKGTARTSCTSSWAVMTTAATPSRAN